MRRAFCIPVLVLCSCGGSADERGSDLVDTGSAASDGALADSVATPDVESDTLLVADAADAIADADLYGPYPAGPYGKNVGDVVPNLRLRGYVNATSDAISTTKPFVASTTLDTLRRTARKPYALLHASEFF